MMPLRNRHGVGSGARLIISAANVPQRHSWQQLSCEQESGMSAILTPRPLMAG